MAITAITELWDARGAAQTWKGVVSYTRKFEVYVSDNTDHTTTILASGSLPARLAAHPTNAYARCVNRKVSQRPEDPLRYLVECEYNSQLDIDPADTNENPLSRPAIVSHSFERTTRATREDLDGNAIDNSASVPFDPPLEFETSLWIIKIEYNQASFSASTAATIQDCCNADTWSGFAPGLVKIRGIEASKQYENNVVFWKINWVLAVKWDGWRPTRVLDQGFHELNVDDEPVLIRDPYGQPLPNPSRLDGAGAKLDPDDPSVFLEFNLCREINFVGLVPTIT